MKTIYTVNIAALALVFLFAGCSSSSSTIGNKEGDDENIEGVEDETEEVVETEIMNEDDVVLEEAEQVVEDDVAEIIETLPDDEIAEEIAEPEPEPDPEPEIEPEPEIITCVPPCDANTQFCDNGVCKPLQNSCIGDDQCLPCQKCTNYKCEGTPCQRDGDVEEPKEYEQPDLEVAAEGFRFTGFVWFQPQIIMASPIGPVDINGLLNQNIPQQIANGQINFIFAPTTLDLTNYPYQAVFCQAQKPTDGIYRLNQLQDFAVEQNGTGSVYKFTSEKTDISVPMQQFTFNLKEATIYGEYAADLKSITNGVITGALPREDAKQIAYGGMNLDSLIEASMNAGNMVSEVTMTDGSKGWLFFFTYESLQRVPVQ